MKRANERTVDVTPSAARLTGSMRDIGYDFVSAVADVVDNSVSAGATRIDVDIVFSGSASYVLIADDGGGMSSLELDEALRFGSRRSYGSNELGRYGLGLKTASISQCLRLTVLTRRSRTYRRVSARTLDVERMRATDRWEITEPTSTAATNRGLSALDQGPGTVVVWELLDRVVPTERPDGGWAKRRFDQLAKRTAEYIGMVFHRFIDGDDGAEPVTVTVNGEKVRAWNPFAPDEDNRVTLDSQTFEVATDAMHGYVRLERYVLPPKSAFSSITEFDRMSGPRKWNRQQGLYVYRADRLIQAGGWAGIRAADEHTKLARAALHFSTDLDDLFRVNVAKMRITLPPEVRTLLEKPVNELCREADSVYRLAAVGEEVPSARTATGSSPGPSNAGAVGAAVVAAALDAGEAAALARIMERLRDLDPGLADALGW